MTNEMPKGLAKGGNIMEVPCCYKEGQLEWLNNLSFDVCIVFVPKCVWM